MEQLSAVLGVVISVLEQIACRICVYIPLREQGVVYPVTHDKTKRNELDSCGAAKCKLLVVHLKRFS